MTTTFRARFEGGKLVPQEPVDLPSNEDLEVEVRPKSKPALEELLDKASKYPQDPDSPSDGAAQHDHYLYGTPKRENP